MTPLLLIVVALIGGAGASLRYLIDRGVKRSLPHRGPIGILIVNLTAAFAVGFIAMLSSAGLFASTPVWEFAIITGFLGGYSTFGTVMVDSVTLLESRRVSWALFNAVGMLVLGVLATLAGAAAAVSIVG